MNFVWSRNAGLHSGQGELKGGRNWVQQRMVVSDMRLSEKLEGPTPQLSVSELTWHGNNVNTKFHILKCLNGFSLLSNSP